MGVNSGEKRVRYGNLIKERRSQMPITQAMLAELAGLSDKSYISKLEAGERWPQPETRDAINTVLGISARDMLCVEGKEPDAADLHPAEWQDFRVSRRRPLHPKDPKSGTPKPLVETDFYKKAIDTLFSANDRHVLIVGEIASGKSSAVEMAVKAWQTRYRASQHVTLLPLTGEYWAGDRWDRTEAYRNFLDKVAVRAGQPRRKHLFIVEDIHEHVFDGRQTFSFEAMSAVDLSDAAVIITTRPEQLEQVQDLLARWSGASFTTVWTSGHKVAEGLIHQNLMAPNIKADFEQLFKAVGSSLVAFSAAMAYAIKEGAELINIELAYRAVDAELDRVFHQKSSNSSHDTKETDKVSLLLAWMLGGIEVEFSATELALLLDEIDAQTTLPKLVSMEEVVEVSDDRYRCVRHPAWGQLVMSALQDFGDREFRQLRNKIKSRILSGLRAADAPLSWEDERLKGDILVTFLYSLLFHDISTVEWLEFMATGRHMHEEFALAGRIFIDGGSSAKGEIENRSGLLLGIASSVRRSNSDDHTQRQELLRQCQIMLDEAIQLEMARSGVERVQDLGGRVLYEIGYLEMLSGDLQSAYIRAQQSKRNDYATEGRAQFGVMSAVLESLTQVYLGDTQEAERILEETDAVFEELEGDVTVDKSRLKRFRANAVHAKFELSMAKKITSSAETLVFEYSDICNEAGIRNDISVYLARVALLEGNYQKALDLTQKAIAVGISTLGREGFNSAYRTLGDAFLGLGQVDRANESYGKVVSEISDLQLFLDHEMQTVVRRRELIRDGQNMEQIALRNFV